MRRLVLLSLLCLIPLTARAEPRVLDPWVRGTVPGQHATGAFMVLKADRDSRLVGARSPVARVVEIHEMKMDGEVMSMRAIPVLALPAGRAVALTPGGYHLMLLELKAELKAGDEVPLTLEFEERRGQRRAVTVRAPVRPLGDEGTSGHAHHHHP